MTARPLTQTAPQHAPLLDVFKARASARAVLVASWDVDFHEAVDKLWAAAVAYGLVTELGVDAVQGLLAQAFSRVPR
jgi:hypothetical protein